MGDYNNVLSNNFNSLRLSENGSHGLRVQGQVPQAMTKPAHPDPGASFVRPGQNGAHFHSLSMGSQPQQQQHQLAMMQRQGHYSPTHSIGGASQHSGSRASLSSAQQLVYENLDYYGDTSNNG